VFARSCGLVTTPVGEIGVCPPAFGSIAADRIPAGNNGSLTDPVSAKMVASGGLEPCRTGNRPGRRAAWGLSRTSGLRLVCARVIGQCALRHWSCGNRSEGAKWATLPT